jgi:hypothetical protein
MSLVFLFMAVIIAVIVYVVFCVYEEEIGKGKVVGKVFVRGYSYVADVPTCVGRMLVSQKQLQTKPDRWRLTIERADGGGEFNLNVGLERGKLYHVGSQYP